MDSALTKNFISFLHKLLENPIIFEIQQRICNNYSAIKVEFLDILDDGGKEILDIGCSTGTCASNIIDMCNNNYFGIDIDPSYIEVAASRSPNGRFMVMDARKMSFQDNSFDLVMFIGVLHHMNDALAISCFKEVLRVLKPGGLVIVAEPVFTPGRWMSNMLLRMDRGRNIRTESGYRSLFLGFSIKRQRYFNFSAHRFTAFLLQPVDKS